MNKLYITYEQPFEGRTFTTKQMTEVYRDLADKKEYPDFHGWIADMVKSGVFEEKEVDNFIDDKDKMFDFFIMSKDDFLSSYSYLTENEYENTLQLVKQIINERINWDKQKG